MSPDHAQQPGFLDQSSAEIRNSICLCSTVYASPLFKVSHPVYLAK